MECRYLECDRQRVRFWENISEPSLSEPTPPMEPIVRVTDINRCIINMLLLFLLLQLKCKYYI